MREKYFISEYEDMTLYAKSFNVGDKIKRLDKETGELEESTITFVLQWSEDPEWYDSHNYEDFETCIPDKDFSFSGEFIVDDDCYYIFAK